MGAEVADATRDYAVRYLPAAPARGTESVTGDGRLAVVVVDSFDAWLRLAAPGLDRVAVGHRGGLRATGASRARAAGSGEVPAECAAESDAQHGGDGVEFEGGTQVGEGLGFNAGTRGGRVGAVFRCD